MQYFFTKIWFLNCKFLEGLLGPANMPTRSVYYKTVCQDTGACCTPLIQSINHTI